MHMHAIAHYIKPVMLVSGILTSTMVYAAIAPGAALRSTFGETLQGPLAEVLVRNWGLLIAVIGVMLIHGAFNASTRVMALLAGGISKVAFITLVLSNGGRFLAAGAGTAVVIDAVMVVLFAWYLIAARRAVPVRA
jgi:hypothetical protein